MNFLFPLILSLLTTSLTDSKVPFECKQNMLKEGVEFAVENPKELEGTYNLRMIPTWDSDAEISTAELTLKWEERYVELGKKPFFTPYVKYPLIGFIEGDVQKTTISGLSDKLSASDTFNPAFRFITETNTLRFPGGKVDPDCEDCLFINADGIGFELKLKRKVGTVLVGEWIEDLGILSFKNPEGERINQASGYFCAELKQ